MAVRWYALAPNMVVYFFGIVIITKLMEGLLSRYCSVYREHMTWRQRRKFVSHAWLAVAGVTGFVMQCTAYMPALFTGAAIGIDEVEILTALSCITIVVYMHDLAYTTANAALMSHHLATALALVLVVFSIDETNNVQLFAMFSTIMLMFETLSGTTYIAMLLHRLWASPVAHPVRQVWAGRFMLAAAGWFVLTRLFVYTFAITRFVQVMRLGPGEGLASFNEKPVTQMYSVAWWWVWMLYLPIMFVALAYAHYHTALVMFKLGLRYLNAKPRVAPDEKLREVVVEKPHAEEDLIAT